MIVEPYSPASMAYRTPGGTLHRPITVNTLHGTQKVNTPPSTTSSRSSGSSGARRVPISAPNAAPLFDANITTTTNTTGPDNSQSQQPYSSGPSSTGDEDDENSLNRSFAVRDQLMGLRERVLELDRRAARLGGLVP